MFKGREMHWPNLKKVTNVTCLKLGILSYPKLRKWLKLLAQS